MYNNNLFKIILIIILILKSLFFIYSDDSKNIVPLNLFTDIENINIEDEYEDIIKKIKIEQFDSETYYQYSDKNVFIQFYLGKYNQVVLSLQQDNFQDGTNEDWEKFKESFIKIKKYLNNFEYKKYVFLLKKGYGYTKSAIVWEKEGMYYMFKYTSREVDNINHVYNFQLLFYKSEEVFRMNYRLRNMRKARKKDEIYFKEINDIEESLKQE